MLKKVIGAKTDKKHYLKKTSGSCFFRQKIFQSPFPKSTRDHLSSSSKSHLTTGYPCWDIAEFYFAEWFNFKIKKIAFKSDLNHSSIFF